MLILIFYLYRAMGGFIVIWKLQDIFTNLSVANNCVEFRAIDKETYEL